MRLIRSKILDHRIYSKAVQLVGLFSEYKRYMLMLVKERECEHDVADATSVRRIMSLVIKYSYEVEVNATTAANQPRKQDKEDGLHRCAPRTIKLSGPHSKSHRPVTNILVDREFSASNPGLLFMAAQ